MCIEWQSAENQFSTIQLNANTPFLNSNKGRKILITDYLIKHIVEIFAIRNLPFAE